MCSQDMTCAMRPPIFLFVLPKRKTAPRREASPLGRPVEERKGANAMNLCTALGLGIAIVGTSYSSGAKSMARQCTPSRVQERGEIPVRSTVERQRYAWFSSSLHCSSGDLGSALGFPAFARSPEDTSSGRLSWSPRTVLSPTGKNGS